MKQRARSVWANIYDGGRGDLSSVCHVPNSADSAATERGARMLVLCLATAALKLSRPPSLSHAEVDDLVARRTRLRSLRDFAAADAVKESLESAGVRLQDEVSGL